MKVLFCGGSEKAPSWEMRARQICAAARVTLNQEWKAISHPTDAEIKAADVIIVVKRINDILARRLRDAGKPVAWDALDFWPQDGITAAPKTLEEAKEFTRAYISPLMPKAIITANKAMEADLVNFAPVVSTIYHHARLDAAPLAFGEVVYYDGSEKHAAGWLKLIEGELLRYGYFLRIGQPAGVGAALLACRDDSPASWLSYRWKSNVKAANAIANRLILIGQPENGYHETMPEELPLWFSDVNNMREAVRYLVHPNSWKDAQRIYHKFDCTKYTLPVIVREYDDLLKKLA